MTRDLLAALESHRPDERRRAVRAILKSRTVPHDELRALAEKHMGSARMHETVHDAIVLLGRLRAMDQLPWLVDHLTYTSAGDPEDRNVSVRRYCPAVAALIEIGAPSIKPVLQRVGSHGDLATRFAARCVLVHVLGRKESITRLRRELSAATDATAHTNLSALLRALESR
jgi:HEAT repeat protein